MLDAVLGVFTDISDWIGQTMPVVMNIFYNTTDNSLTILGVLAVASLAISVAFLLIGVVTNFVQFRG